MAAKPYNTGKIKARLGRKNTSVTEFERVWFDCSSTTLFRAAVDEENNLNDFQPPLKDKCKTKNIYKNCLLDVLFIITPIYKSIT